MPPKNSKFFCRLGKCRHRERNHSGRDAATPLTAACGCRKFRVCKIRGDRKMCARMAQLGVLPGSEIELVCGGESQQCMVRVKGSTVTLDHLWAENIMVTPAELR